jgi:hypothetical protein
MTDHVSVKRRDSLSPATTPVRSRLRATRGSLAPSVPGAAATAWLPRAAGAPGLGPVRAVDSSGGSRALGRVARAAAPRFRAGAPARSALRRAARRPNPTPDWSEPWPLVRLSPAGSCSTSSRLPAITRRMRPDHRGRADPARPWRQLARAAVPHLPPTGAGGGGGWSAELGSRDRGNLGGCVSGGRRSGGGPSTGLAALQQRRPQRPR